MMARMIRRLLPLLLLAALPLRAATYTVTKTADTLDGACDRDCSLREAVSAANAGGITGPADVVVLPPGIYALTRTGAGEDANATGDLDLTSQVILVGAGAGSTVIDGLGFDRVLDVHAPAEIWGVTIRNGRVDGDGGGLLVRPAASSVLLRNSVVSGNQAQAGRDGGGIAASSTLEVRESAILENHAEGDGGGIAGIGDTGFILANVTLSDNRADGSGGALDYEVGHGEAISGSTIAFNQAGVSGGGIRARSPRFPGDFGGQVFGSIVSDNFAPADRDCTGYPVSFGHNVLGVGEGCSPLPTDKTGTEEHPLSAVFRVQDTRHGPTPVHVPFFNSPALGMVPAELCEPADQLGQARSVHEDNLPCDAGAFEQVERPACLPGGSVLCLQGGRFRVSVARIERFPSRGAQALPLTGDSGNYWLFAPDNLEVMVKVLDGCALNQRWWLFASGLTDIALHLEAEDLETGRTRVYETDAGVPFPPRLDTNAFPCSVSSGSAAANALTALAATPQIVPGQVFRVTKTADTDDGACDHDCSLREAVLAANSQPSTGVIVLGPGVYELSLEGAGENAGKTGDLDVSDRLLVLGAGAGRTAIDARRIDRVFEVLAAGSLEIHDAAVRNGEPSEPSAGGGIQAEGDLTLIRAEVRGNRSDAGGGIAAFGNLTVRDSTIADNESLGPGGGIDALAADLENVTVSGNRAAGNGGGLSLADSSTALRHVTVTGNRASQGGGVSVRLEECPFFGPCNDPPFTIERTVIAGNIAGNSGGDSPDCHDLPVYAGGFNVFGIGSQCRPQPGDRAGTFAQPLEPGLSPLGGHGGPTSTHLPLPGSPAVDVAPAGSCPGTDQRGRPRPSGGCDAGAVERLPGCQPDETNLCLGAGDRFRVTVRWTAQGGSGSGKAVPLALDTGAFWFFDPDNLELTVKVLDGCGVNDRFWVFLTGVTDVGVEVTVEDTATGKLWIHTHTAGAALQPRLDTNALEVCP